jgi:hypothetical protein
VWGAGHGVYYNDGQDGSTSAQALARYTTGNSTNGVTVPSPHSVSPAQTCSTWTTAPASCPREIFFYDMGTIYNDTNAGISQAQSEQNVINTVADAHADGYFVVIMPTYLIQVGNVALTAQIQAINLDTYRGATGADLIAPMDQWLTDATDPVLIDVDHIHPTVKGDQFLASRLMSFLISGGTQDNYTSYYATEIYAAGGMQVLPLGGTPSPLLAPFQVGSQGAAPTGGEGTEGTVFGRLDGCQFSVQKNTGNPEQIAFCVYDSGNYAAIQSAQMGVGNTPLELNPLGGSVLTGPGGLQGTPNGTTAAQTLHGIDQLSATDTVRTPVPAQSCIDYHLPVTGLLTSGAINVPIISGSLGNLSLTAYASTTAGQMNMHFCNPSAVTVTPPANTYYWLQFR